MGKIHRHVEPASATIIHFSFRKATRSGSFRVLSDFCTVESLARTRLAAIISARRGRYVLFWRVFRPVSEATPRARSFGPLAAILLPEPRGRDQGAIKMSAIPSITHPSATLDHDRKPVTLNPP
jgi:hypothetical protein